MPWLNRQGGPDVKVTTLADGRRRWCVYDGGVMAATGLARTRLGLAVAVRRALRKVGR